MDLKDKVCLITGGTRGIGAATAVAFAEQGADVAIAARRIDDEAHRVSDRVAAAGRRCLLIATDVAIAEQATASVDKTVVEFGGIDVVVHSAGGPANGGLLELTPEAWYTAFDVHIHPIFYICRAAIPHMRSRGEGAIILISSTAGIRGIKTNVAYQTVKGALPQLTRALAYEFANDNIRVNCVAPGVVRTDFHATMSPEVRANNLANRIPLHREGTSEQVATVIREMATNDYVTGETYTIDGGLTMRIA